MTNDPFKDIQLTVCERFHAPYCDCGWDLKLGIAKNVKTGLLPINGVRSLPENGTSGWYIWAGEEMSSTPDFFVPLHTRHIANWCEIVIPYLGLAPGWTFLITPNYEDVWEDKRILAGDL